MSGHRHEVIDYVALDSSTQLVAEYLVLLHDASAARASLDYASVNSVVDEWFPVRALAIDAALKAPSDAGDMDTWVALGLAEVLKIPLVTKNPEVSSTKVPILTR